MTTTESCAARANAVAGILAALLAAGLPAGFDDDERTQLGTSADALTVRIGNVPYQLTLKPPPTGDLAHNVVMLDWNTSMPIRGPVRDPLPEDHHAYWEDCSWCGYRLGNGLHVQTYAIGPTCHEDRRKHYDGETYPALHLLGHAICIQGVPASPAE